MQQSESNIFKTVFQLSLLVIIGPLAMDMFIPALPELRLEFNASQVMVQQTLGVFITACAITQLLIGPITDKFGRRKIAILGAVVFLVGSYMCSTATELYVVYFSRAIQAFGSSAMLVTAFAIVRDKHSGERSAIVYSYLNGAIAFSPIFAPAIGSWIDLHYGWREIFDTLAIFGGITLVVIIFFIKETLSKEQRKTENKSLSSNFIKVLSSKQFLKYTIASGFGFSYLFTFFSISPYIILDILKISKSKFGMWFAIMGVSIFIGSVICANIVGRLGTRKTVFLGVLISFISGMLMLAFELYLGLSILVFVLPMLGIGIGATFAMGAGASGALEHFKELAGTASSLLCFLQFIIGVVITTIVTSWAITSSLSLAIPVICCSIILFFLFRK